MGRTISSRENIAILKAKGWEKVASIGDPVQLKHPHKKGNVTVKHPEKDISGALLKSIEKQAGIRLK
ncbi:MULTISPECIES: type II toxin-antitoxin system HicA family toxin [Aminobacterium]|uniref:type II toxin-antitoxin system HicA family toxin n=1 Tax=Aminobacterium TaxID=81466 RepID=UPI0004B16C27|nr:MULTISPECIES: type II toxin-antitoxin system HicA family toxin [Aminobacterium]